MRSLLQKFRLLVSRNDRSAGNIDPSFEESPDEYVPIRYFYLNNETSCCVQTEVLPSKQVVRVFGVDTSLSCMDFAMKLSMLLGLQPSSHLLMVPNLNFAEHNFINKHALTSRVWQRAPSNSKLALWLNPIATMEDESGANVNTQFVVLGNLRLVHRSCLRNAVRSGILETHLQNGLKCSRSAESKVTKSGRELLDELGTRVLVHLPVERKLVIRANLNRPVFEAVAQVCAMRNLIPNQYYLRNPHTGAPLDPLLSFRAQRTTEFELQDCNPFESNLNCLINITDPIQWPSTDNSGGLCLVVKPQLCTGRSTTISPRTRSSPLPPRHSSQNSQPTLDNWSISGTSSMKPKPTDRRSLLDITWSGQSRTPPSTIFNLRCRKKRRAPPPPPSALQSRTRLDKEKVQLSRSWHDLVRKSSSPQPVKSTTSVYLNTSLIDAQSGFINSDKALNTALDSGTITTTSIGFCTATRTRTLVECPQLGIEVFRAHTLPRARVKSRTGHEPCIESVLAQSKLNGLSDSMLAKAVRFSGTEQNGDHLTIVPWLSETANKLETLRSPNVARNSSIKPMKDVVERSTRMHRSSLPSDLNTENETEEEKLDTMQTSENVIVHEQHLPQTAVGIPVQNKPSPAVAERPSKDLVATYICKRFSSQSSAPVSPSNVNATSQAVGAQYPNCFMSELNEVISRIRHVES